MCFTISFYSLIDLNLCIKEQILKLSIFTVIKQCGHQVISMLAINTKARCLQTIKVLIFKAAVFDSKQI